MTRRPITILAIVLTIAQHAAAQPATPASAASAPETITPGTACGASGAPPC